MALNNITFVNYTDKETIKNWFKTGLKPTQAQFWSTWDSFWHKSESLPISSISGLGNLLDGKAKENHEHAQYVTNDATSLTADNVTAWQQKLGLADLKFDDKAITTTQDYAGFGLQAGATINAFNNAVYEAITGGEFGENFSNTDLVISENRKHTGTASVELAIPMIYSNENQRFSGLVDKSADATYDKVMVLDSSGKAGVKDANDFGNVKTVNGKSPDSTGNTDIGIDDTLRVNDVTERVIEFEDGGINLDVIDEEGLVDKKFFAYSIREKGIFRIGTGCGNSTGWSAPTFFGWGSLKKLNRNNATTGSGSISAYGYNSLTSFEGGVNGGITSIGSNTLFNFVGTNDPQPIYSYFMTALGVNALFDFLNGSRNTALGGSSGRYLVTGSNNTFTGAASMQELEEGSNNIAIGYQVTATLKKGSNNTFIGANLNLNKEEVNDTVIIADGTGKQHFKSDDKGSILPSQTIALIDADETGKAIITKEFVDSKISNFKLPTNWESPQQRFSGLVDKSADATYNKVMVLDSDGKAGMKDVNEAYLNPDTLINILESATTEQIITIREILYPQI